MNALVQPEANGGAREQNPAPEDPFYSAAYARINWAMLIIGAVAAAPLFWFYGRAFGAGYLLGTAVAFLNIYWLRNLISKLMDFVTQKPASSAPGGRMAAVFLLRYSLIGLGAYAIFLYSLHALYGFFAGLALPVAGIFCEAAFEVVHAWRVR